MKLEAVVVCVGYADFLCWSLPLNKGHFNNMVVVTSTADVRTQKLCEYWHVKCVVTDVCYEGGASFNKGKMINAGLAALKGDAWVAHMDADIVLPPLFRTFVEGIQKDQKGLYHLDRMMCDNFDDWLKFFTKPLISNENDIYVHPRPFPLGVRLAKREYGGWLPLGYFQMWNQGVMKLEYPTEHTSAARTDLQFTTRFSRGHRHMLPEMIAIHLETKLPSGSMGANWQGRKTPPFGPAHEDDRPKDLESITEPIKV